jgi:hypothetical protein
MTVQTIHDDLMDAIDPCPFHEQELPSPITILHKGVIFGTCDILIFLDARRPDIILYDMQDTLTRLSKKAWPRNYKPIHSAGIVTAALPHTPEEAAQLVDIVLRAMKEQYAADQYKAYSQEIINGRQ